MGQSIFTIATKCIEEVLFTLGNFYAKSFRNTLISLKVIFLIRITLSNYPLLNAFKQKEKNINELDLVEGR